MLKPALFYINLVRIQQTRSLLLMRRFFKGLLLLTNTAEVFYSLRAVL